MAKKKAPEDTEEEKQEDVPEEKTREQALSALFKAATKNYGAGALVSADEATFGHVKRISTGCFPLDYGLGGGLPVGRISCFYGHKSTSKTTNYLRALGNAQKMCSACWTWSFDKFTGEEIECSCGKRRKTVATILDVEGTWDEDWSRNFIRIDDTVIISQPSNAEQAIDLAHAALKSQVDILLLDSIAFLQPTAEQERSAQDQLVGTQARLVGVAIRKFVSAINELGRTTGYRPSVWTTNQIRMKVGTIYGSPETVSGGLAAGFATSVEARTAVGKYEMDDVTGKPMSVEMKAKITKNKTAPAQMEIEWKVNLMKNEMKAVGEVYDEEWALSMGEKAGLVSVAPQNVEWDGKKFRGKSLLVKHWMENKVDYDKYKNQLMPVLLAV